LIPLIKIPWSKALILLFLIAAVITQYIFPHNYVSFELFTPHLVILHAIRNMLLVLMALIFFQQIRSPPLVTEREYNQ
jgi:hypothetical protein